MLFHFCFGERTYDAASLFLYAKFLVWPPCEFVTRLTPHLKIGMVDFTWLETLLSPRRSQTVGGSAARIRSSKPLQSGILLRAVAAAAAAAAAGSLSPDYVLDPSCGLQAVSTSLRAAVVNHANVVFDSRGRRRRCLRQLAFPPQYIVLILVSILAPSLL